MCGNESWYCIDKDIDLYRCRACGFIFNNPRPAWAEIVGYYCQNNKYDKWLTQEPQRQTLWKRRLKFVKKYKQSGCLLDVGAGIAQFLDLAKDDFNIRGTEISTRAIEIAKQKYNISIDCGEIENITYDYRFDVITIFHVLEHLYNPLLTIKKSRELLRDDGIIFIAVPNDISSIKSLIKSLLGNFKISRFKKRGKFGLPKLSLNGTEEEIHVSHFSPSVLKRCLEENGFIVIESNLDRYYAAKGIKKAFCDLFYFCCLFALKIFKINLYDTILIVAKKDTAFSVNRKRSN